MRWIAWWRRRRWRRRRRGHDGDARCAMGSHGGQICRVARKDCRVAMPIEWSAQVRPGTSSARDCHRRGWRWRCLRIDDHVFLNAGQVGATSAAIVDQACIVCHVAVEAGVLGAGRLSSSKRSATGGAKRCGLGHWRVRARVAVALRTKLRQQTSRPRRDRRLSIRRLRHASFRAFAQPTLATNTSRCRHRQARVVEVACRHVGDVKLPVGHHEAIVPLAKCEANLRARRAIVRVGVRQTLNR